MNSLNDLVNPIFYDVYDAKENQISKIMLLKQISKYVKRISNIILFINTKKNLDLYIDKDPFNLDL